MNQTTIQILLVEDNPSDSHLFCQMFLRADTEKWQLVCVERLSEAVAACSNFLFDVVLLDLSLPDSDGLETVAVFHAAVPDLPIVVLTGSDDEDLALQAMAEGAQDYLIKDQITVHLLRRSIRYAVERGKILKQLHESEGRFRGIFEQTFQSMALLTNQGIILELNQTALSFYNHQSQEVIGLPFWETNAWNYSQFVQEWVRNAVTSAAQGEVIRQETQVKNAQDQLVWIDFSLKQLKDEWGKIILLIAEGRDISDRKKAEAETLKALAKEREVNLLRTSFISMVSHEFRNPMTAIRTASEILQNYNEQFSQGQRVKYFEQINTAINYMLQLLDEVLLLGRTETGRLQYQPTQVNLKVFFQEMIESFEFSNNNQHPIIFRCEGDCDRVEADEILLRYILKNLISNAIKYSPGGSNIWLNLSCDENRISFWIQDQGMGIPQKDQQHLFEMFYRGSNVNRIQGTGLGLAIVKKCVELHGGEIHLESEVGVGTKVTVTVPLNQ